MYCPSITPLPEDFADQVLELEMKVDCQPSIEALRQLLELYSQAIEYYESKKNKKYLYYQERMKNLLVRQEKLLEAQVCPSSPRSELSETRHAEKAIKTHNQVAQSLSKQVQLNIQNQNQGLKSRLSLRLEKRNRSLKESDVSGGPLLPGDLDCEFEKLVEKYLVLKMEGTEEIKAQYEEQMKEIREMPSSPILEQLLSEMQARMDQEIQDFHKDLERRKRQEYQFLKSKFV